MLRILLLVTGVLSVVLLVSAEGVGRPPHLVSWKLRSLKRGAAHN